MDGLASKKWTVGINQSVKIGRFEIVKVLFLRFRALSFLILVPFTFSHLDGTSLTPMDHLFWPKTWPLGSNSELNYLIVGLETSWNGAFIGDHNNTHPCSFTKIVPSLLCSFCSTQRRNLKIVKYFARKMITWYFDFFKNRWFRKEPRCSYSNFLVCNLERSKVERNEICNFLPFWMK